VKEMTGKLILIGCGPGAGDLLTFRAAKRISEAHLVLYDRLIDPEVLVHTSAGADIAYVGKRAGDGGVQQADINVRIYEALRRGQVVARLKSGDPMVFGRAAEEIAIAKAAGAEIEIVPGVTAALAAAADAEITVTERQEIRHFVVTTGRSQDEADTPDWESVAKPGTCIAFYMGVAQAWRIQSKLLAAGVPGHAPADWIERAGQACARTVSTRVDQIALAAAEGNVSNPAILMVRYPLSLASAAAASREPFRSLG